ncbi:MAG: 6,7-dimethyl-8-ribityllumazine synthase, partial [Gemmatimonadetes bacterium]|nr:6,7-dimethyl-8-ribityllumazine synthase [Gemmatimonadota bacterium]
MPKVHEGQLDARDRKFAIAVSRYNDLVTTRLLDGALVCMRRHGCVDRDIDIDWYPGAGALPIDAKILAGPGRFDVV